MKNWLFIFCFLSINSIIFAQDRPLQIIMIGAHPDDCDIKSGGTAALFVAMGHHVKFVSVTNGDAGHQSEGGGMLAKRRIDETKEVAKRLGVSYDVLDNHDGELLPTLEIRLQIIRKIREWKADVVIAPRSNDYHPDHRYTGVLVQDAAFMVGNNDAAAFVVEVKQAGVFGMRNLNEVDYRRAIGSVAPNVLFPYARAIIAQLVALGGFPQMLLPPVNFDALYARSLAEAQEQAQGQLDTPPNSLNS